MNWGASVMQNRKKNVPHVAHHLKYTRQKTREYFQFFTQSVDISVCFFCLVFPLRVVILFCAFSSMFCFSFPLFHSFSCGRISMNEHDGVSLCVSAKAGGGGWGCCWCMDICDLRKSVTLLLQAAATACLVWS